MTGSNTARSCPCYCIVANKDPQLVHQPAWCIRRAAVSSLVPETDRRWRTVRWRRHSGDWAVRRPRRSWDGALGDVVRKPPSLSNPWSASRSTNDRPSANDAGQEPRFAPQASVLPTVSRIRRLMCRRQRHFFDRPPLITWVVTGSGRAMPSVAGPCCSSSTRPVCLLHAIRQNP
jgi:hypothetical protein